MSVVGDYRLESQIGAGVTGTVYRARHVTRGSVAAVKIVRPRDRESVKRWFDAVLAASAIRHPGLVEVYDVGLMSDGTAFVAMELVAGEALAMRKLRLTWNQIVQLLRSSCGALDAARACRLVHGNLKPTNVFVVPDREAGERVKLLDFGSVHLIGETERVPTYMAPEQCRGAAIDHRTDIYALGCMVYEVIVGHPPFVGSVGDVFAGHLFERHRPLATIVENMPRGLSKLVERMLAKNAGTRPHATSEISDVLDGLTLTNAMPKVVEPVECDGLDESDSVVVESQH